MPQKSPSIFTIFRPYWKLIIPLLVITVLANGITIVLPKIIAGYIDQYQATQIIPVSLILWVLLGITLIVAILTLVQSALASYASEKVAFDLRKDLSKKIANQSFHYVSTVSVAKLLTVMTSDVDNVKNLISQGLVAIFSAVLILVGSAIALMVINLKLALLTLAILPLLVISFMFIFGRIGKLFRQNQENLEKINRVVNESIVASSLIRVLNAQSEEINKFDQVNSTSTNIGIAIVKGFASLFPIINVIANSTILIILWYGGQDVIRGDMTLGDFSAFFAYTSMLIMPIFIIAFISNALSRSFIAWQRISEVLESPVTNNFGNLTSEIKGSIEFDHVSLAYGNKTVLKDISFTIKPGTKNAIVGPISAGKTQILYLLAGLVDPTSGTIKLEGNVLNEYSREALQKSIGLVFQDSSILNATLRENIQLAENSDSAAMEKAIETAQLSDLINSLPQGLDTPINERGSNLSGGQKQRLMLARALALNPKILLLDDFTARVDQATEQAILNAIEMNYPKLTLLSITQKIRPIEKYDQIIVLMEGEVVAVGTHEELLDQSLEYKQISESQKSSES